MPTLCHCNEQATVPVEDLLICIKCDDFLTRHPALKSTLIDQWRAERAKREPEPVPRAES